MHIINVITDDGLSIYYTVRPRGVKNYLLIMCRFLLKKLEEQKNVVKNEITLFLTQLKAWSGRLKWIWWLP